MEASISKFEIGGERVLTVRLRDITERKRAEEQIKNSLHEKEVLLKEIHHRVKNNLQVVSSLLSLQSGYPRVESVRDLFVESQNRVKSMALIHEKLYQSQDLANIDFSDYIESLAHHLFHSYTANPDLVTLTTDVDVSLDIDHAIPCGLIVNELLSNSLKHAFPDERRGAINLYFHVNDTHFTLRFADDGGGLPVRPRFSKTRTASVFFVADQYSYQPSPMAQWIIWTPSGRSLRSGFKQAAGHTSGGRPAMSAPRDILVGGRRRCCG